MKELTAVLKREYKAAETCQICLKYFNNAENRKERNNYHYTGLYRGTMYNNYNLKYRIPEKKDKIEVIEENKEMYISFNVQERCKNLVKFFDNKEHFSLMRCKGIYPYEYVDS